MTQRLHHFEILLYFTPKKLLHLFYNYYFIPHFFIFFTKIKIYFYNNNIISNQMSKIINSSFLYNNCNIQLKILRPLSLLNISYNKLSKVI